MDINLAASQLAELGHPVRLKIIRLLVKAGPQGLEVNEIKSAVVCPGSTLSHHISRLLKVGLLRQERNGRILNCHAQYKELNKLVSYLFEECCSDDVNGKSSDNNCCDK